MAGGACEAGFWATLMVAATNQLPDSGSSGSSDTSGSQRCCCVHFLFHQNCSLCVCVSRSRP